MKVNHRITDFVQRLGTSVGLHVTRADNTLPFKRQSFLHSLGIDVVLDIGANVGNYVTELRAHGYQNRIVSFEPIAAVFETLRSRCAPDAAWSGVNMALGDTDGRTEINVSHNLVSSSLLEVTAASVDAANLTAINSVSLFKSAVSTRWLLPLSLTANAST